MAPSLRTKKAPSRPRKQPQPSDIDWFSEHAAGWAAALGPRLSGRPGMRALFVGPFDGRCVGWTIEHLLTGGGARVTVVPDAVAAGKAAGAESRSCIGPVPGELFDDCVYFRGTPTPTPDLAAGLRRHVGAAGGRVVEWRPDGDTGGGRSARSSTGGVQVAVMTHAPSHAAALLQLRLQHLALGGGSSGGYDLVYLDARSSRHALEAAALSFPLLRPDGRMVITNYTHSRAHDSACPRRGIDGFLDAYASELQVLRSGFHVLLARRPTPIALPPCRSEYFDGQEDPRPARC
jgi:hypothetical protein